MPDTQAKQHKRNSERTCICGCGKTVYGRWPYLKGHVEPGMSKVSAKQQPVPSKRAYAKRLPLSAKPNGNGHNGSTVELHLHVDETWLDAAWARLSLNEKALAIAHAVEGV